MKAVLLLEDGACFTGQAFGARGLAIGEVVFNTGMTGYQEILTDPSYKGQIVTMTYPHIGNYGINPEDIESDGPKVEGLVVRELCRKPSNYRSTQSLDDYLRSRGICGIHQIDTRALTRHIRQKGSMMGILSSNDESLAKLGERLSDHPGIVGKDLVQFVTIDKEVEWKEPINQEWYYEKTNSLGQEKCLVVAYDFGIKRNILRLLTSLGMRVLLVPAFTPFERIREINPDGIFLSNGPGDPEGVQYAVKSVKKLSGRYPFFGICLGHQILGLALGAKTYKLKFGHHGSNHPVKNLKSGVIEITAQNHNFAIDKKTLNKSGFIETHRNLNDGTVEGMKHRELPVYSVQYHPEASPGPHDSVYLFREFYHLMADD